MWYKIVLRDLFLFSSLCCSLLCFHAGSFFLSFCLCNIYRAESRSCLKLTMSLPIFCKKMWNFWCAEIRKGNSYTDKRDMGREIPSGWEGKGLVGRNTVGTFKSPWSKNLCLFKDSNTCGLLNLRNHELWDRDVITEKWVGKRILSRKILQSFGYASELEILVKFGVEGNSSYNSYWEFSQLRMLDSDHI